MIKKIVLLIINFFDFFHQKKIIHFLKNEKYMKFDTILDVGAHKGETINLFLKNFPFKKIISFEASPHNFFELKQNLPYFLKKYQNTKIVIENIALGNEDKTIKFKQFNESSSSTLTEIDENSSYYRKKYKLLNFFNKKNNYETFDLKIYKLSDYIKKKELKYINFLKIDTEGSEFEVIEGLENYIEIVGLIMFEHHYHDMLKKKYTFSTIHRYLLKCNFKKIYKSKMPFRKTFEYIYLNKGLN